MICVVSIVRGGVNDDIVCTKPGQGVDMAAGVITFELNAVQPMDFVAPQPTSKLVFKPDKVCMQCAAVLPEAGS